MKTGGTSVDEQLRAVTAALGARLPQLVEEMRTGLVAEMPDLGEDQSVFELLTSGVEASVATVLHVIEHGIEPKEVEPPAAAVEYARRLAQRNIPFSELVRAYRLGQAQFMRWCHRELTQQAGDAETALAAALRLVEISVGYVDRVSEQLIQTYQRERERWVRHTAAVGAEQIRSLLEGGDIDPVLVERIIGHRLNQVHLGLVAWVAPKATAESSLPRLERLSGEVAQRMAPRSRPLFMPRDECTAWVWIPLGSGRPLDPANIEELLRSQYDTVRLAVGEPAFGVEGFRRTIRQALRTHSLVMAAGSPAYVTTFETVGPVALMAQDLDATRDWVLGILGPLGVDDEQHRRLRETLYVFLATGGSFTETAVRSSLHKNTVHYRVRKAEEVRGRPVGEDRLNVELALLACRLLGSAVLSQP